jgi:glyoxylase-like metal-dependent hydrolase (beta-lactamase superfamily II)
VKLAAGLYRISEPFGEIYPLVGVSTVNMYLVIGSNRAALIDSGMGIGNVAREVVRLTTLPCMVLNTHSHWDHIGANNLFTETALHDLEVDRMEREPDMTPIRESMRSSKATAALPPGFNPDSYRVSPRPPTRILRDGDEIDLGDRILRVIHTPGHSPGHVAYLDITGEVLFTGDIAYDGPIYACFGSSNPRDLVRSLQRLAGLPNAKLICPGHNEPVRNSEWLGRVAHAAELAVSGRVPGELNEGIVAAHQYHFQDFSILLPLQ